jgi:ligand-binding sensor domain-containing protein
MIMHSPDLIWFNSRSFNYFHLPSSPFELRCSGALWVGTQRGACRWNSTDNSWRYFYLQRYLPGQSVVTDLASANGVTLIVTDGGLALIEEQQWTLAEKAEWYETILARHDRHGELKTMRGRLKALFASIIRSISKKVL